MKNECGKIVCLQTTYFVVLDKRGQIWLEQIGKLLRAVDCGTLRQYTATSYHWDKTRVWSASKLLPGGVCAMERI